MPATVNVEKFYLFLFFLFIDSERSFGMHRGQSVFFFLVFAIDPCQLSSPVTDSTTNIKYNPTTTWNTWTPWSTTSHQLPTTLTTTPLSTSSTSSNVDTATSIEWEKKVHETTEGDSEEANRRILIIGMCVGLGAVLLIVFTVIILLVMKRRKARKKKGIMEEQRFQTKPGVKVEPWVPPSPQPETGGTPAHPQLVEAVELKTDKTQTSYDLGTEKKMSVAKDEDVTTATQVGTDTHTRTRTVGLLPNYLSDKAYHSLVFEVTQPTDTASDVKELKGTKTNATQMSDFQESEKKSKRGFSSSTKNSASRLTQSRTANKTKTVTSASKY